MSNRKKSSPQHSSQIRPGTFASPALWLGVLAGVALIALAAFFAYLPSLSGGFVLDDNKLLTDNRYIKAADGLYHFWCTTAVADYWPVSNTSLWLEWRLWGMNSTGYHVTNLILHIAASLLIWIILRKLAIPGAFLAAMLFAVHPVNVESVAWISSRKNLLAMLFFLLSILCYLIFEIPSSLTYHHSSTSSIHCPPSTVHRPLFYWLSLLAFVLAMLSKGSVAILPLLLLLIVWWLRTGTGQRLGTVPIFASAKMGLSPLVSVPIRHWRMGLSPSVSRSDLLKLAPFFLIAMVLAAVNVWFQTHGTGEVIRNAGFAERLLGAGGVVWFYLYKALLPLDLCLVYPQWHIQSGNLLWWLPLLAALVVTAMLWRYRETWGRPFLLAWGFFCIALLPVLGFTDVGFMRFSLVADRYQHIAVIGVIALAAAGWSVWRQRSRRQIQSAANAAAVIVLFALTLLTWRQSRLYADALTLYQATLEKNPACWMAHNNLGMALLQAGQPHKAMEHFQQALRLNPDYPDAHQNLGLFLVSAGRLEEAMEHCQQVLRLKPYFPEAYNNLGVVLFQAGRTQEAILHFQQAMRLDPNYAEAYNNLGVALVKANRLEEAIAAFTAAVQLNPDYLDAYDNLMSAYAKTSQADKALATAQKALDIARSKGLTAQARQFEDKLNSYRSRLSK